MNFHEGSATIHTSGQDPEHGATIMVILRLFDVSRNFLFIISETKCDYN